MNFRIDSGNPGDQMLAYRLRWDLTREPDVDHPKYNEPRSAGTYFTRAAEGFLYLLPDVLVGSLLSLGVGGEASYQPLWKQPGIVLEAIKYDAIDLLHVPVSMVRYAWAGARVALGKAPSSRDDETT